MGNFTSFGHMIWVTARSQVVMSLRNPSPTWFYGDPFLHEHGEEVGEFSVDWNSSQGTGGEATIFCRGISC